MPLPRFQRLAPADRARILGVARAHFARDGQDGASYNRIIADAGISKASAYHYFDGKADLFGAVVADASARVAAALGAWSPQPDARAFWRELAAANERLLAHLAEHPDDRALLAAAPAETGSAETGSGETGSGGTAAGASPWTAEIVTDARRLGLVTVPDEPELLLAATQGVLDALDRFALTEPGRAEVAAHRLPPLLARLWGSPASAASAG
ncbi:TetR/AcrR family transcriptional regulator [Agromyces mediolanus]|uniref:TetR/AcrR family transcriptional regulator n=1 Tax=Agromyces mediolanus TaxID=41986 RepID=UPI0038354D9E